MKDTDRELLVMAARAVGINLANKEVRLGFDVIGYQWNPLEDDGDAFRIAIDLRLDVNIIAGGVDVYSGELDDGIYEPVNGDLYKTARRTIVRAAAEIGKAMK